ncbi:MAG: selenide, water dikinase SelD [Gemmatimonadota bacterium]
MKRAVPRPLVELILVGGGHTHVQVLKSFAMQPPPGVRTTVVVDTPIAVYSGMVPGFVAGQYRAEALEIDVLPLARLAEARVVIARATSVDAASRRLSLEGRASLPYDVISFDIGSTVAGLHVPGVAEHALPTRPIGRFVTAANDRIEQIAGGGSEIHAVIVGAGAGGVELAFTFHERLKAAGGDPRITLVEGGPRILSGYSARLAERVERAAAACGIDILTDRKVSEVQRDRVVTEGVVLPSDLTVWVAGSAPHTFFCDSGLPTDEAGFVRTRSTLQVEGFDEIFAAGDCARLIDYPWVPRAGVYAVRQGPVLIDNLRRFLSGDSEPRKYRPQADFLTLLNLGDGTAIGSKRGLVFAGPWVFRLKDRIDRKFMRRFQMLDDGDEVTSDFTELADMRANMDVSCGGCAAKLGQDALERALGRLDPAEMPSWVELSIADADDAAAYETPGGTRVVSSVDQFSPFTDDPFLTGRVGAVNAASDVFAKGVAPCVAQAIIALPTGEPAAQREEMLYQVLAGARSVFDEMGVALVGGHTTSAAGLLVGFHVEGFVAPGETLFALRGLEPEQTLILTKPLGTGVLLHADMKGRARGRWFEEAVASMVRPNGRAAEIARSFGATAATDITGFGLARHLGGMLGASERAAVIDLASLPVLPGVSRLLAAGLRSTAHAENADAARGIAFDPEAQEHANLPLLFDPQTSGGLLFGVAPELEGEVVEALTAAGYPAAAAIGSTKLFSGVRLQVTIGR